MGEQKDDDGRGGESDSSLWGSKARRKDAKHCVCGAHGRDWIRSKKNRRRWATVSGFGRWRISAIFSGPRGGDSNIEWKQSSRRAGAARRLGQAEFRMAAEFARHGRRPAR